MACSRSQVPLLIHVWEAINTGYNGRRGFSNRGRFSIMQRTLENSALSGLNYARDFNWVNARWKDTRRDLKTLLICVSLCKRIFRKIAWERGERTPGAWVFYNEMNCAPGISREVSLSWGCLNFKVSRNSTESYRRSRDRLFWAINQLSLFLNLNTEAFKIKSFLVWLIGCGVGCEKAYFEAFFFFFKKNELAISARSRNFV